MMILVTTEIFGQSLSKPIEGYLNSFGAAVSGGGFW